jgi:hypothetical protein
MTSSFSMPGGVWNVQLFRAEPLMTPGQKHSNDLLSPGAGKAPMRWVHLSDSSSPPTIAPMPPARPAEYVGQIIAVVVSSAAARV